MQQQVLLKRKNAATEIILENIEKERAWDWGYANRFIKRTVRKVMLEF